MVKSAGLSGGSQPRFVRIQLMFPPVFVVLLLALSVIPPTSVHALESDRDQPALIEADEVELDFASGQRIYRGNVSIKQGTIRIIADEVELYYHDEQLEKAIARGNPAVFRQRPDQKPQDVIGQSKIIELDEINNIVTFIGQATIRQGRDAVSGDTIVYDMARDKMNVRGRTRTTKAPEQTNDDSDQSSQDPAATGSDRPRIVLQPRSKETSSAQPAASTGSTGAKDTSAATLSNNLQAPTFRAAYVVEGGAMMYGVRSQASPSIGVLNVGEPVKVIASSGGWFKVNVTRGVRVWIYGRYVSGQGPTGTVSGDNVRLRSTPSTEPDSVVVGKLMSGARVRILEVSNDWKKISPPVGFGVWVPSLQLRLLRDVNDVWSTTWQNSLGDDGK